MIIDCHVHVAACTPGHGWLSSRLRNSLAFQFMRWRLGLKGYDEATERALEDALIRQIHGAEKLDAAVVLAFDAVHDDDGRLDARNTHLYVTNNYVIELSRRHPKVLFGASVHPYRKDAVREVERCAAAGAVLLKWLPIVQKFNPADRRCLAVYEALAHYKLPLLSHTGGEQSLPALDNSVRDPVLLTPALQRGVTVIAAHCGTKSAFFDRDYLPQFIRMAHEHENFYGDTAALNLPTRSYAYAKLLAHPMVREKLVHGSDWPIFPAPSPRWLGVNRSLSLLSEQNWIRRDMQIKESIGFDENYWRRAARLLRLPNR